jgi:phosphatidate cytidylyltransferase
LTGGAIAGGVALLLGLDGRVPGNGVLWSAVGLLALGAAGEAAALEARRGKAVAPALLAGSGVAVALAWAASAGLVSALDPRADAAALALLAPAGAAFLTALTLARGKLGVALLATAIGTPLAGLAFVRLRYDLSGLVVLIVLLKVGDIAGYFGGRAFGRHHPFPGLSPGKTIEGCAFSLAAGVAAGAFLAAEGRLLGVGPVAGAVAGGLINLAAQAGDLLESGLKRRAGVKDSGALMGASGGILDVLDSLLLAVPIAWLLAPLAPLG